MLKKSLIVLSALAGIAIAAPAFASTDPVFGTSDYQQLDTAKAAVAQQLQQRGLNVSNVDEWDGYVRADVTLPDGSQAVRFFQPNSLEAVSVRDLN